MQEILELKTLTVPDTPDFSHLVPPPRFGRTSFESFKPQHPSQEQARDELREFALQKHTKPVESFRWPWQKEVVKLTGRGLYLDGGFGVGKTHLLAAAFHESGTDQKAYVSFQELVYVIGLLGMKKAKEALGAYKLFCIDEFELDDPGNTLIVKTFLADVFERDARVITTSNTPPEAQGRGRFNAEHFAREIQSIAERFRTLKMEGPDYRKRHRLATFLPADDLRRLLKEESRLKAVADWDTLLEVLARYHPIRYRDLLRQVGALYLSGVRQLPDQNQALRFVHFIDKLYDMKVRLRASGDIALDELFHPSYRHSAFAKKHERCLSRLSELLEEERQVAVGA